MGAIMERPDGSDTKNALSGEPEDFPDSGMPRQLRTQADDEEPLSRAEADAAGLTAPVYGEDSINPNGRDGG